jgi:hypothetical protein
MLPLSNPTRTLEIAATSPELLNASKERYQKHFEDLKNTLFDLGNPYLVSLICEKLTTLSQSVIDVTKPESLEVQFDNPRLPLDLKEMLKRFATLMCAYCSENISSLDQRIQDIKRDIGNLAAELTQSNQSILERYARWEDFQLLFTLPELMSLRNVDFTKLKQIIDQGDRDKFGEHIDTLAELQRFDLERVKQSLTQTGYQYNLDTLLSEVIENKPLEKEGILNYWDQPDLFFTHKKLHINNPEGSGVIGSIVKSKKKDQARKFHLDDHSLVLCQRDRVTVTRSYPLMLWSAIVSGSLAHDDVVSIMKGAATNEGAASEGIATGKYIIKSPRKVEGKEVKHHTKLRSKDSVSLIVELADFKDSTIRYRIVGHYNRVNDNLQQSPFVTLHRLDPTNKTNITVCKQSVSTFNQTYTARKLVSETLIGINAANLDQNVLIKSDPDDDRKRLLLLKEIEIALETVRSKFLEKDNLLLLQALLSDFYTRRSPKGCLEILEKTAPHLFVMIKSLVQRYQTDLKIDRTEESLLAQLMLEANYVNLVNIQDNVIISRTMGLLEQAFVHIDNMAKKDLVFVMGNTGAGKSTAITHLLGGQLEEFTNKVGEKVVKQKESNQDYPRIGQSIGTSETLYTQGYLLPNTSNMIADCPGFNDTRGGNYELCTNISIDYSISKAGNIRSIVIVVPLATFTLDRGNPIIDLIYLVQDKFPSTFDPDKPENNKRIFLLISKQNQVHSEVAARLKDGTRFAQLISEGKQQFDEMRSKGVELNDLEIQQIRRRNKIWEALSQMLAGQQIDFIDWKNLKARERLVKKYCHTQDALDKSQYVSPMSGEYMQRKFGNVIKMAAYSWNETILGEYFNRIPEAIKNKENECEKKETEIKEFNTLKQDRLERAESRYKQIEELGQHLQKLKDYKGDQNDPIHQTLLNEAAAHENRDLEIEKEAVTNTEKNLKKNKESLEEVNKQIEQLDAEIKKTTETIAALTAQVTPMEMDNHDEVLWDDIVDPDKKLEMKVYKSSKAREDAYKRGYELDSDYDSSKSYNVSVKDYRGKTVNLAFIPRGFKLVPADPAQRTNFINTNAGGGFIAKVDGLKYKIDLKCRPANANGTEVVYGYTMTFDKKTMPWLRITHTIPNFEYHYATIAVIRSKIIHHEKNLLELKILRDGSETLTGAKAKKTTLEAEIAELEQDKISRQNKVEQIQNSRALEQLPELTSKTQTKIEQVKEEYQKLL